MLKQAVPGTSTLNRQIKGVEMEKKNKTVHRKETPVKKRDGGCYQKKVEKITKWYNQLVENQKKDVGVNTDREHPDKLPRKRAELKDLDFYISKIKKVVS
jgi:hypothetical protein